MIHSSVASVITWVQISAAASIIILVLVQVMKLRYDVRPLRFAVYGAFIILIGGVAFGKYYASTAPERLKTLEVSQPLAALSGYTEGIRLNPSDGELYFRRGRTRFYLGQFQNAISDFTQALERSPDNQKYLSNRALTFIFVGDLRSAENDVRRAIQRGDQDSEVRMVQGLISLANGRYDNGIAELTAALSGHLDSEDRCLALLFRGISFGHDKKDYTRSLNDLNAARNCERLRGDVLVNLGNVYDLRGQGDLALREWGAALQLDPSNSFALRNRGIWFAKHGQLELALSDFNRYIQLRPNDPTGYMGRSGVYEKMNDHVLSQADMKTANELLTTNRAQLYPSWPNSMSAVQ